MPHPHWLSQSLRWLGKDGWNFTPNRAWIRDLMMSMLKQGRISKHNANTQNTHTHTHMHVHVHKWLIQLSVRNPGYMGGGWLGHWDLTYWPGCCCSSSSITSDEDHSSCPHLFSRCDESEDGYSKAILGPEVSPTFWAHIFVEPTVVVLANLPFFAASFLDTSAIPCFSAARAVTETLPHHEGRLRD